MNDDIDFTWGYRVFRDEKGLYGLFEVYYDRTGKIISWTDIDRDLPRGYDDPGELIDDLERMLNSAKKHKNAVIDISQLRE
jgi:hypothetical protein